MRRIPLPCALRVIAAAVVVLCACREPPGVPGAQAGTRPAPGPRASAAAVADAGERGGALATLRVAAKNPLGVPLHPEPESNRVSGRLADGTEVRVLQRSEDGRWYQVRAQDGRSGWITRRYVELPAAAAEGAVVSRPDAGRPRLELPAGLPWASAESCQRALAAGRRPARASGSVRIATWNLKWFPDGGPGRRPKPNNDEATDPELARLRHRLAGRRCRRGAGNQASRPKRASMGVLTERARSPHARALASRVRPLSERGGATRRIPVRWAAGHRTEVEHLRELQSSR